MAQNSKITTGANDRPRNETISQTGAGAPDDSARPVEVSAAEEAAIRAKLQAGGAGRSQQGASGGSSNPDAVPAGTQGAGENICRRCSGTGQADGRPCPDCDGSGKVVAPIGGG
jgi:hypothetical protein